MRCDPVLGALVRRIGPCHLARRAERDLFQVLLGTIVSQQLSAKASDTIYKRVVALVGGDPPDPAALLAVPVGRLREAGLSGRKAEYVHDLAARVTSGSLALEHVQDVPDEEAIATLTTVRGIGRWSAEMVLIFRLLRPDVLPLDDVGLLNAAKKLYRLRTRPTPAKFTRMAEPWRPWRSVACWYLWAALDNAPAESE